MLLTPEWERHKGSLLAWPQRPELWQGHRSDIQSLWARIAALLSQVEEVRILIHDTSLPAKIQEAVHKYSCNSENIFFHNIPTDDVWIRDYGPTWVGARRALHFDFDGWGKKYAPYQRDQRAAAGLLKALGHQALYKDFVLEGGAWDTDGESVLASGSCLLFRRPFLSQNQCEKEFYECFSAQRVLWIKGGLPGDDTDGHLDMVSRFIAKNKILTSVCEKNQAPYDILNENRRCLQSLHKTHTQAAELEILDLPLPLQAYRKGRALPRSYANFYIANTVVLVPVYGEKTDDLALRVIQDCLPHHRIEAIDATVMILEGGGVHCMTKQIPEFVEI